MCTDPENAHSGSARALKLLRDHGAHAERHRTALFAAARAGHGHCVQLLADHGVPLRGHESLEFGDHLLRAAAASGQSGACEPLVRPFADDLDAAIESAIK